jgi:hypothetical protein
LNAATPSYAKEDNQNYYKEKYFKLEKNIFDRFIKLGFNLMA